MWLCRILVIFISIAFLSGQLRAANWYIDKDAKGSGNGRQWRNAWIAFKEINWKKIKPGDTIYISGGKKTKTYHEPLQVDAASGTKGMPIAIKIGSEKGHNGIAIISNKKQSNLNGKGIYFKSEGYFILDGEVNGKKHLKVVNNAGIGIEIYNSHHMRISNIEITNNGDNLLEHGIYIYCDTNVNNQDLIAEIHHCEIHHNYHNQITALGTRGPRQYGRIKVHHNEIYGQYIDTLECGIRGLDFYDNYIHSPSNPRGSEHTDGVVSNAGYVRIYNNTFENMQSGKGFGNIIYLGMIYSGPPINESGFIVYNNLVYNNLPYIKNDWGNHALEFSNTRTDITSISDMIIANNTFSGLPSHGAVFAFGDTQRVQNVIFANNIIHNCYRIGDGQAMLMGGSGDYSYGSYNSGADFIIDYNIISPGNEGTSQIGFNKRIYKYKEWQKISKCQNNIKGNPNPLLDKDNRLTVNSPGKDAGMNLNNFFKNFNQDEIFRNSSWDIGAYKYRNDDMEIPNKKSQ